MSIAEKSAFQQTDAGWIPEDWVATTLGKVVDFRGGNAFKEKYQGKVSGDFPFVKVSDFNLPANQIFIRHANNWIDAATNKEIKATLFEAGSVVFAKVGAALLSNRRRILTRKTAIDNNLMAAIPRQIDPKFCYYHLQTVDFGKIVQVGAIPSVNQGQLQSLPFAHPSLLEQQKIAAILTAVDDKLEVITRQIEATQTLKQGLMQKFYSRGVGIQDANGVWVTHTEFKKISTLDLPAVWTLVRLGEIAPLIRRPTEINPDATYPELGLRSYGKGTFHKPALLGTEVGNKRLFEIKTGDLLFSNVFAWEGAVAVAKQEDDGRFGSHRYITCIVDKSRADTSYVFRYLITPAGIASLTLASPGGAGRNKTLGLGALGNITIPLPPLAEQQKISQILDDVDTKLQALESKESAVKSLKRGLMQMLLTGELRIMLDSPTGTA